MLAARGMMVSRETVDCMVFCGCLFNLMDFRLPEIFAKRFLDGGNAYCNPSLSASRRRSIVCLRLFGKDGFRLPCGLRKLVCLKI